MTTLEGGTTVIRQIPTDVGHQEERLHDPHEEDAFLPSPERIHRMGMLYQKEKTERERRKRSTVKTKRWAAPEVSFVAQFSSLPEE
jgi:hypothetical protein